MRGSFERRVSKDGRVTWTVRLDLPPGPDGQRRQRRLSAPTRREAEALAARVMHEVTTGSYVEPDKTTVGAYLTHWLATAERTIRPSTYGVYRAIVETHLIPALGTIPLSRLKPLHIEHYYAKASSRLAPSTVRQHHAILHRAFDQAVRWHLLPSNPTTHVEKPRLTEQELNVWSAEQAAAFVTGSASDPLAALWHLAIASGMRQGELLALRWPDVDLERSSITVQRTLTRDRAGSWTTGEPKSSAGRRTIALPGATITTLVRHKTDQERRRQEYGAGWVAGLLVFDRGDGQFITPSTIKDRFDRLITAVGLPRIRFHDLRHTSATIALEHGVGIKILAERLGHSSPTLTLTRYAHVTETAQRAAATALERAIFERS